MANPNAKNVVNQPTETKKNRNLVREFVSPFVEMKLSSEESVKFYNHAQSTKGDVMVDFLKYWKNRDDWNNLTKEEKGIIEAFDKTVFLKEIVRIGVGFESKRSAVIHTISRDYDFSTSDRKKVE